MNLFLFLTFFVVIRVSFVLCYKNITLYEHDIGLGLSWTIALGNRNLDFCTNIGPLDNKVSSAKNDGLCIKLWEEPQCKGRSMVVNPDSSKCVQNFETCYIDNGYSDNWDNKVSSVSDCNYGKTELDLTPKKLQHFMPACDEECFRGAGFFYENIKTCCSIMGYKDGGHCLPGYKAECIIFYWTNTDDIAFSNGRIEKDCSQVCLQGKGRFHENISNCCYNQGYPSGGYCSISNTAYCVGMRNMDQGIAKKFIEPVVLANKTMSSIKPSTESDLSETPFVSWSTFSWVLVLAIVVSGFFGALVMFYFKKYRLKCSNPRPDTERSRGPSAQLNLNTFYESNNENLNSLEPSEHSRVLRQVPECDNESETIYEPINYDKVNVQYTSVLARYDHLAHCQPSSSNVAMPTYARIQSINEPDRVKETSI